MHIAGYIASLFIGLSLGLIGGGGSIFTVPVLVYLFGISPVLATSYSLFIVGATSLIGAFNSWQKGFVDFHTAFNFGISSIITVFVTRKLLIPNMPETISVGNISMQFSMLTMILFGLLMLVASFSMITNKIVEDHHPQHKRNAGLLMLYGIGIGLVTGFLGAGGGFLLIPALVLLLHQPMKKAVGTSLLIIALNSLVGFAADIGHHKTDWMFLSTVAAVAIAGVYAGGWLHQFVHTGKLRNAFGWFILIMGLYIIAREIWLQ